MFESYETPYKLKTPVLEPSGIPGEFDALLVDAPHLFRHHGKIYMMYIGYDGRGYQTALAVTEDMIHWKPLGVILPKGNPGEWDQVGRAGTCIIADTDLYGQRELKKIDGKYWLFFHSYPGEGYEVGAAAHGIAWTDDESLMHWHIGSQPIFTKSQGNQWDSGGLYGNWVFPIDGHYCMFYNGKENLNWPWHEQVGLAFSDDMLHWKRYEHNPVLPVSPNGWDCCFSCGQHVLYDSKKKRWVMFYCGYDGVHAQEGVAVSSDMVHWEKKREPIIPNGPAGSLDETHAHKPGIIWHEGILYHYYCSVRPARDEEKKIYGNEYRCITAARSIPW